MTSYYFTFGSAHTNADGSPLRDRYTIIEANDEHAARLLMYERRGQKWCTSYRSPESAGVSEFSLTLIPFDQLGPQPAEQESDV